jgi:hypothetical protein
MSDERQPTPPRSGGGGTPAVTPPVVPCPCPPCPRYDSVDSTRGLATYNCAGLALRTYAYVDLSSLKSTLGAALANCSGHCAACQVKFWLWEWDPWSLEFKDTQGRVVLRMSMPPDFHTVSGRCDCHGNDPSSVNSKNGSRPLEGPSAPSTWRVRTGDVWTENASTNRPLYYSLTATQISSISGLSASDLYLGSTISGGGVDIVTNADVQPGLRYLKCFVNIADRETCYCRSC